MHRGIETLQRLVARLMVCGWPATKIARRLHRTPRAIRYLVGTPEFGAVYAQYEAEVLEVEDRKVRRLWPTTVRRLLRLLKHPDPRIALDAIDQVHTMLGPLIERHVAQALERPAGSRSGFVAEGNAAGVIPAEVVTDESRELARQLMRSIRAAQPQRDLPADVIARVRALQGPDQN